ISKEVSVPKARAEMKATEPANVKPQFKPLSKSELAAKTLKKDSSFTAIKSRPRGKRRDVHRLDPSWERHRGMFVISSLFVSVAMVLQYSALAPFWEEYGGTYYLGVMFAFMIFSTVGAILLIIGRNAFEHGFLKRSALLLAGIIIAAASMFQNMMGAPLALAESLGLLVAIILCILGSLKMRELLDQMVVWTAGCIFVWLFATSSLASFGTDSSPSILIQVLGLLLVSMGIGLYIYGKWVHILMGSDMREGDRMLANRDYASALGIYEEAQAKSPEGGYDEMVWLSKGSALIKLGRYDEAISSINEALRINPRNETAWNNKGNALSKQGKLDEALRCFKESVKIQPSYEIAWNNMGNVFARKGQYDKAISCYNRAISLEPGYKDALINKGYVLVRQGRYEEAIAVANRVTVASPG
ncbi:MAG: tetratricopeptide repeat protein, partial [Candidatus Thermoplasmatota archaeon]|nr:tetratricopeptide repeat protein [Candidatus Thermoplasmatota archaeon]